PCGHCSYCDFRAACEAQLEREDHLVRVAGIRRDHVRHLRDAGVETLTALATRSAAPALAISPRTLEGLIEQAALQLHRHRTGALTWKPREVEPGRGFSALPARASGDLVLDFEGHPLFEPGRGLQYLFGALLLDDDAARYRALWAHDRDGERRAFEALVDLVHARLAGHPGLHGYHFGAAEPGAIKQLMSEHATREAQVDDLLRRQVFVDLRTLLLQ